MMEPYTLFFLGVKYGGTPISRLVSRGSGSFCEGGSLVKSLNSVAEFFHAFHSFPTELELGGPCQVNDNCSITSSVCLDGTCSCASGFRAIDKHTCLESGTTCLINFVKLSAVCCLGVSRCFQKHLTFNDVKAPTCIYAAPKYDLKLLLFLFINVVFVMHI